jgi:hypothetical protein
MMRGILGQPFINLEPLLPLHLLDEEAIDLELAEAPRVNNVWGNDNEDDFVKYVNPPPGASQRVLDFYEKHKNDRQTLQQFTKLAYGVYSPTWVVKLAEFEKAPLEQLVYQDLVDSDVHWKRNREGFPCVQRFIDESGIFATTGRIIFFITDHYCPTPVHKDDFPSKVQTGKEFVWISLKKDKGFFIYDEATKTKHKVTSRAAWFHSLDFHGADPCRRQTWSLRIDGKFTPEFREKIAQHKS